MCHKLVHALCKLQPPATETPTLRALHPFQMHWNKKQGYFWGATLGTIEPGHVICRAGGTRLPWVWLPWAAWIRPSLCHLAWSYKCFMSCHRCCCGCRDVSEDNESGLTKYYFFLLHSEIYNISEHQFCWARSELGFYDGHMGNQKCSGHPPYPCYPRVLLLKAGLVYPMFACEPLSTRTHHWWSQRAND